MGDRGNIVVQEAVGKRVYLYTHWRGSEIKSVVQLALQRHQRWNDPAYLARIIFCQLLAPGDLKGETGYGISATIGDNGYPVVVVDCERQRVYFEHEDGTRDGTWERSFNEIADNLHPWPPDEGTDPEIKAQTQEQRSQNLDILCRNCKILGIPDDKVAAARTKAEHLDNDRPLLDLIEGAEPVHLTRSLYHGRQR